MKVYNISKTAIKHEDMIVKIHKYKNVIHENIFQSIICNKTNNSFFNIRRTDI